MFRYWLHDRSIDDYQMFGRRFHRSAFPRITRIEEQGSSFQAHPVTFPSSLSGQFNLMFLTQQPFLYRQEAVNKETMLSRSIIKIVLDQNKKVRI